MADVSLLIAFIGGMVSFLAPCVLPIIPGYIAYLAGTSIKDASTQKSQIFMNSLFFVIGFGTVFSLLGLLLNTVLSTVAYSAQEWLSRIGGLVIIFFGLYMTGLMKIDFLEQEHRIHLKKRYNSRYLTSFLFGTAFAAGWSPCVGAVLGAILGIASSAPSMAFALLLSYSIGFGIPFLLIGFFAAQATSLIQKYGHLIKHVNLIFGVLLIIFGILIFTQTINRIANFELLNSLLLR